MNEDMKKVANFLAKKIESAKEEILEEFNLRMDELSEEDEISDEFDENLDEIGDGEVSEETPPSLDIAKRQVNIKEEEEKAKDEKEIEDKEKDEKPKKGIIKGIIKGAFGKK